MAPEPDVVRVEVAPWRVQPGKRQRSPSIVPSSSRKDEAAVGVVADPCPQPPLCLVRIVLRRLVRAGAAHAADERVELGGGAVADQRDPVDAVVALATRVMARTFEYDTRPSSKAAATGGR